MEKTELYGYRAGWKEGLFEAFKGQNWMAVTLTLTQEVHDGFYSEVGLRGRIHRWMVDQGVAGFVVVETSRAGRLHAHGLVRDGSLTRKALAKWSTDLGKVVVGEITDLIGWLTYMLKAFGPESQYVWRKDTQLGLGS